MRIGAAIITHNCVSQDYCLHLALESLLGVCDEVVCVDADSNDATPDLLERFKSCSPKLRVFQSSWKPNTSEPGKWLADLSNEARSKLNSEYQISIQADEVLHLEDYPKIRKCAETGLSYLLPRLNFWKDSRHLVPPRQVCGHNILRMGPSSLMFTGDAENLDSSQSAPLQSDVRIFHYGFLRKLEAQIIKGVSVEESFYGVYNPCYDEMKRLQSRDPFDDHVPENQRIKYDGSHPDIAIPWLLERGRI